MEGLYPDRPNANGRVYPRKVVESIAEQMKNMAEEGRLLVMEGPPSFGGDPDIRDVVALGKKVEFDDPEGEIHVEIEVLLTPAGKALAEMMEQDLSSFTPVAEGKVTRDKEKGVDVVENATFNYLSFGPKLPDPPTT